MGRNTKNRSSSCSESSESSVFVKSKHRKHRKSESESECESEKRSECNSDKKNKNCKNKKVESESDKKKCSESSHSDHDNKKHCFEDVYKYYKYRLLTDDHLMVAGSSVYNYSYNNIPQTIPVGYPVNFPGDGLTHNVYHPNFNAPFAVRESGIYVVFFVAHVEQASQFTIFVNGIIQELTVTGNNSGAGQLILRHMMYLHKHDTIMIRNYMSNSALTASSFSGGKQIGNNFTFLLMKISALPCAEHSLVLKDWSNSCLSRKKLHLFKKLLEKMLCDKELMLKGFNVHGTFFSQTGQSIATEANVVWDKYLNVSGLNWSASNPDQMQILEDGVYKVFFNATTNTSAQFSICVNDVPYDPSTQGSDKGAGQITTRTLLELRKGDFVTIKNHTSTNSNVVISSNAGGFQQNLTVLCTVFKIAPLCKAVILPCKLNDYHRKCYEKFKNFLLTNKCLQIAGSNSYCSAVSTNSQVISPNEAVNFEINTLSRQNIEHVSATSEFLIMEDGVYDIFADVMTQQSAQITLFVNGTPDMNTVAGRDSGASRTILRQFVKLYKGDVLTVRNYDSHSGDIETGQNSGGSLIGHPATIMAFRLAPIEEDCYLKPCSKKNK